MLPQTRTIFLVDTCLYYDPSSGPRLHPSLAAPFRAPTFVYCKGGRMGQRYIHPSFLTPQVHSCRCGITQHDKGQAPLANPQQGACPPPTPLAMVHEWGPHRRRPVCARTGRSTNGGVHGHTGAPPCLRTNGGCAESPLLPPLRGTGRYVPPPLAPDHTLTGSVPPLFAQEMLTPCPVCVRMRFAPESRRGMALPFRHEWALHRKPPALFAGRRKVGAPSLCSSGSDDDHNEDDNAPTTTPRAMRRQQPHDDSRRATRRRRNTTPRKDGRHAMPREDDRHMMLQRRPPCNAV
jgi:hypothetical protein